MPFPKDYEFAAKMKEFEETFGFSLTGIGHVEDGSGVRVMNAGVPIKLSGGFRHFEA